MDKAVPLQLLQVVVVDEAVETVWEWLGTEVPINVWSWLALIEKPSVAVDNGISAIEVE